MHKGGGYKPSPVVTHHQQHSHVRYVTDYARAAKKVRRVPQKKTGRAITARPVGQTILSEMI